MLTPDSSTYRSTRRSETGLSGASMVYLKEKGGREEGKKGRREEGKEDRREEGKKGREGKGKQKRMTETDLLGYGIAPFSLSLSHILTTAPPPLPPSLSLSSASWPPHTHRFVNGRSPLFASATAPLHSPHRVTPSARWSMRAQNTLKMICASVGSPT